MFLYTTTHGRIRVCDFRESSNFQQRASAEFLIGAIKPNKTPTVFDKWLVSVSGACFVPGFDHLVVSRDYLHTSLWDLRAASSNTSMVVDEPRVLPIYHAQVTDYMTRSLTSLYDHDSLEDQFFVDVSPDGKHVATGAYNRSGHVMDLHHTTNTAISCKFHQPNGTPVGQLKVYTSNKKLVSTPSPAKGDTADVDLRKRVQLGCWRPTGTNSNNSGQTLALVFRNCIYLY